VSLGGGMEALPAFPNWNDPDFQQILPPAFDINASAGRQTEGFIDVAHFAWIHHDSFADRHNPVVPQYGRGRRELAHNNLPSDRPHFVIARCLKGAGHLEGIR